MLWREKKFRLRLKKKWENWILFSENCSSLILKFWVFSWIEYQKFLRISLIFFSLTSLDLYCNFPLTQEEQKFVTWKNNETKISFDKKKMRNGPKRKKAANIKKNHWIVLFLFPFHIHPHFPDRSLYLCSLLFFLAMCHTKFTKKEWKSSLCVNKFLWWIVWYRRVGGRRKRKNSSYLIDFHRRMQFRSPKWR